MKTKIFHEALPTNDLIIRSALREDLRRRYARNRKLRIIEELGVQHGNARIDIAVVNGTMHGYEIKSDQDTLKRLPEQMDIFNAVFDKMTLIVGKNHLYEAINIVPDWWGIVIAKTNSNGSVVFSRIRRTEINKNQNSVSVARLLWREEALRILEEQGEARGFYSKPRNSIYEKLALVLDQKTLGDKVREAIFIREDWRPDAPLVLNGG